MFSLLMYVDRMRLGMQEHNRRQELLTVISSKINLTKVAISSQHLPLTAFLWFSAHQFMQHH